MSLSSGSAGCGTGTGGPQCYLLITANTATSLPLVPGCRYPEGLGTGTETRDYSYIGPLRRLPLALVHGCPIYVES